MDLGSGVVVIGGVGHRCGLHLAWLWWRPTAVAPIHPLAWEPPYATGAALKRKNKKWNFPQFYVFGEIDHQLYFSSNFTL